MKRTKLIISFILFFSLLSLKLFSVETVHFKIRYGFINGGNILFKTEDTYLNGRSVYHTVVDAKTTGFIDNLYKLHDIYESYYDKNTKLPYLAIQNLKEGKYRKHEELTFDQQKLQVHSSRKDSTFNMTKPAFDIISAIQHLRNMDWSRFENGQTIDITMFEKDETFPLYVIYKGKETITIGSYKYACHKFVPVIDPGKILKKKEDMTLWFSDDQNKIPVSIKLNLVVGAFRLEIDKVDKLPYSFTAQSNKK